MFSLGRSFREHFDTHVGQVIFHLVVRVDVVAVNDRTFQFDCGQTVFSRRSVAVAAVRVQALVEVAVLVQIAPQYPRRQFARRVDHCETQSTRSVMDFIPAFGNAIDECDRVQTFKSMCDESVNGKLDRNFPTIPSAYRDVYKNRTRFKKEKLYHFCV